MRDRERIVRHVRFVVFASALALCVVAVIDLLDDAIEAYEGAP